jgi:hypothetical protein
VVDLNSRSIYVHRESTRGEYAVRMVLKSGDRFNAEFAPDISFTVDEILG